MDEILRIRERFLKGMCFTRWRLWRCWKYLSWNRLRYKELKH